MKSLIILLFATVIASGDAAQKCEEVTDPCTPQLEDAEPNTLGQIAAQCSGDLADVMFSTISVLGSFLGLDPPDTYFNTFFASEREGVSACLVETDKAFLGNYQSINNNINAIAASKKV
ncbi:CLUMA_CG020476, isoform A [Clunio marinus]|uniref:CLUMA_CG020476, isoform A n=1 Tax=Clunio marinus TaxID=568069 RepID=A0A1J1J547_9DIPT|nr:CLUMA_CG020476, isoform A [Clunio marinus]